MRILITGGSGFVCLNIAQKLLMEGNDVFIYDKASLPCHAIRDFSKLSGTLKLISGDILDSELLKQTIVTQHITHVIHGAAITPTAEQEKSTIARTLEVNFGGTINVLEVIKDFPSIPLIYISSMAAIGTGLTKSSSIPEAELTFYPTSSYGIAKFASEQAIQEYCHYYSIKAATVRLGAVFGPWEYPNQTRSIMSPALRILQAIKKNNLVLFNRFSSEEWIYSKDVANYIYTLLLANEYYHSSYCLVSGFKWSTQGWCDLILSDYPEHSYRLCLDDECPTIRIMREIDNASIKNPYIFQEFSYRPVYTPSRAYKDYTAWLAKHPDFIS